MRRLDRRVAPYSPGAAAARQDADLMAKWTAATIVRYRIVAEFSGEAVIVQTRNIWSAEGP